ncbi:MAG: ribosomal small subunit pseudouridine synthase [Pseudomonadota bacterium]|jgi:16S rRNA pseudouridine516 synthase
MQLERLLQSQGFGTRKACRNLVRAGLVTVAGTLCDNPSADIDAVDGLPLTVDGESWAYCAAAYLVLNKPAGYECSQAPKHHPSVYGLLPWPLRERGVQSVGRLDEDTTGLLLFSDDGQFIHMLSSGKRKVPKRYRVTTKHPVSGELVAQLLAGVTLHDEPEPIIAAACEAVDSHQLLLTVTEGKYHQVKRMVAAAGNRVEALHRDRVGHYDLPADLAQGQWRWLTVAERALLHGLGG